MRYKLIIILLLLISCGKRKDKYPETSLGGHGCSGLKSSTSPFHDNSKEAFNYALSFAQINFIEIDVRISKDGTAWMFHDPMMEDESNGSGCLSNATDVELASWNYKGLKHEKLACLLDLPSDLKGRELILDLRINSGCDGSYQDSTLLFNALTPVANHFQNTTIYVMLNEARYLGTFHQWGWKCLLNSYSKEHFLNNAVTNQFDGVSLSNETCSADDISTLKAMGYLVVIYSVRSPKYMRKALKKGPQILLVDELKTGINEKYR